MPLLVLSWLGSTIALHLAEWPVLPSAAADFEGPSSVGIEEASMSVVTDGELTVDLAGSDSLYGVEMVRRGGATPAARSFERIDGGSAQVTIDQRTSDLWFVTEGWRLTLNSGAQWNLDLEAGFVDADLRGGDLSSLRLAGSGDARLAEAVDEIQVTIDGRFELIVPPSVVMTVSGADVSVPAGWTGGDGEWTSPGAGEGYVVTVTSGASLVVREP